MRFEGKVAVVTGAGRGIGEAYAKGLAREGAAVVVAELDAEQGERVAREIRSAGGRAAFVATDVSDEASTRAMGEAAREAFGGVDYLVNNAAIYGGMKIESLLKVDWDYYNRFMAVNMNGAVLCTRAVYKSMHERGGGAIVNQSSTAAWMGAGFYGIAKLALHGITHTLASELGWRNIRVNAIAPGPTDTEATRSTVDEGILQSIVSGMPLKRLGTVDDMVHACLFLLSDEASWITGHILNVDGGQVMRV
ncbi:SDR family oxidoreductase [Rhabdothermincola sp.]|jgi:3-oxoacyl-[acyl-carrier protein] reductase|uniref:SDR family oxidoreductase n=1 Tax=Rhabdothermincola sp. TaxID=2820405 RepID=UPI002FE11005